MPPEPPESLSIELPPELQLLPEPPADELLVVALHEDELVPTPEEDELVPPSAEDELELLLLPQARKVAASNATQALKPVRTVGLKLHHLSKESLPAGIADGPAPVNGQGARSEGARSSRAEDVVSPRAAARSTHSN
jgi:hypothetical protein